MALNIFIDSSFIVSLSVRSDLNHKKALALLNKYQDSTYYINDLIVYEVTNVLCRLGGVNKAKKFNITVERGYYQYLAVTRDIWGKCVGNIYAKYTKSGPNVFDYIHFACMQEYGLKNVLTFDHHFASAGFNVLK